MNKEERLKKIDELTKERDKLSNQIKELYDENTIESLKDTESKYLGKYYENNNLFFKVISSVSENEYRIAIVGFYKNPSITHENEFWDSNFHRHPFCGRTEVLFMYEDDIMISQLNNCKEITKDEFKSLYKTTMNKFWKQLKKTWKIEEKE